MSGMVDVRAEIDERDRKIAELTIERMRWRACSGSMASTWARYPRSHPSAMATAPTRREGVDARQTIKAEPSVTTALGKMAPASWWVVLAAVSETGRNGRHPEMFPMYA